MALLHGKEGSITFANGYTTCPKSYSVAMTTEMKDTTCLGATSRTRQAGLEDFSGTYTVLIDDTTVLVESGAQGTATFTFGGARNIVADIIITDVSITDTLEGSEAVYSFVNAGAAGAAPSAAPTIS